MLSRVMGSSWLLRLRGTLNVTRSILLVAVASSLCLTVGGCGPTVETYGHAHEVPADSIAQMPTSATDITVRYGSGQHTVIFSCTTNDLVNWVDEMRNLSPELNTNPDPPNWLEGADDVLRPLLINEERSLFNLRMDMTTGFTERLLKYSIVRSATGGTTVVWHDPETLASYQWTVYH